MRRSDLGEFEEVVLLAVAVHTPEAYSVVIAEELEQQTGKTVSTGAVHAALQRLENKGLVSSQTLKVHAMQSDSGESFVVVALVSKAALGASMMPFRLSKAQARALIQLLERAAS